MGSGSLHGANAIATSTIYVHSFSSVFVLPHLQINV